MLWAEDTRQLRAQGLETVVQVLAGEVEGAKLPHLCASYLRRGTGPRRELLAAQRNEPRVSWSALPATSSCQPLLPRLLLTIYKQIKFGDPEWHAAL